MHEPITTPATDEDQIRELSRLLQLGAPTLRGVNGEQLDLPQSIYDLLKEIIRNMRLGNSVTLLPENQQLTTQRAADLLGISRPHLIKLLTANELPHHMAGSHRRIYLKDVVVYARRRDAERSAALDSLTRQAYAVGLYDDTRIPEGGDDE